MVEAKIDTDKKIFFTLVLFLIVFGIGRAYAYFSANSNTNTETVTTATYDLKVENDAILRADDIVPIKASDVTTKATELPFTITNTSDGVIIADINLTGITMSKGLDDINFKWALYSDGTKITEDSFYNATNKVIKDDIVTIDNIVLTNNVEIDTTKDYKLYIWIEDNDEPQNTLQGSNFEGKITVNAIQK
ncbi:MAG: hypothetical protein E7166_02365 [Firmicutes bacterium]|nr:hypothetical protein [Bacillota bacterium]